MKKLTLRLLILFSPIMVIGFFFAWSDPMKVVYEYDSPLEKGVLMNDRHYQTLFLCRNKEPFNSFITGSSRSKMYITHHWKNYLGPEAVCFHLGVNDESIWGVTKKLEYLDKRGYKIKNCLLPIDTRLLRDIENNEAHIFRDHPEVSGETYMEYYKHYAIAFLQPSFLTNYIKWKTTGVQNGIYFWRETFKYDKQTGDIYYIEYDSSIAKDKLAYYAKNARVFYDREKANKNLKSSPMINKRILALLHQIKTVFDKHHTSYQIVITPNYDQLPFNQTDLELLRNIFGDQKVHNFSGKNTLTDTIEHYYEHKHFKPFIANITLEKIYQR